MKGTGIYSPDWAEISLRVRKQHNFRCERCGRSNNPSAGYTLTVHHLNGDKSNNQEWNLACLCQRCHLKVQNKVVLEQDYMFEHSNWFQPHLEGYLRDMELTNKTGAEVK